MLVFDELFGLVQLAHQLAYQVASCLKALTTDEVRQEDYAITFLLWSEAMTGEEYT